MSLLVSPVSMLVLDFVGSVCEASSSVYFSEGVPSGIRSSGCERGLFGLLASGSLTIGWQPRKKKSSRDEEGINALCQVIDLWVTESLGGGIDSREEIDLWLLHHSLLRRKPTEKKQRRVHFIHKQFYWVSCV